MRGGSGGNLRPQGRGGISPECRTAPGCCCPLRPKCGNSHAKILQSAVTAERGFDVVLGEQNAMIRQMPCLPRGVYVDKSVARTKTQPFRRLTAAGNKVAAWCEEGLVYRDRDNYLHERVSGDSLAHTDMFFAWGQGPGGRRRGPRAGGQGQNPGHRQSPVRRAAAGTARLVPWRPGRAAPTVRALHSRRHQFQPLQPLYGVRILDRGTEKTGHDHHP